MKQHVRHGQHHKIPDLRNLGVIDRQVLPGLGEVVMEYDGYDIFIIVNGMKIAKRGHPGTPQAQTWISLEPGWYVQGVENIQITRPALELELRPSPEPPPPP